MQHKLWFDEECLDFLSQRKHTKIQSNVDILNNVRREGSRHFRNKNKKKTKKKKKKSECET
jgi:hypothetical protein